MIPNLLNISISFIVAYILGSIPNSYYAGKIKGIDIRKHGSGNVGSTNALRILGVKIGIIVLVLDILKGFLSIIIAKYVFNVDGYWLLFVGIFAIIGHIFTFLLKFKGGKGVATTAGVFLALTPIPLLLALAIFFITVYISKYVSLGSILGVITLFCVELFINIKNDYKNFDLLIMIFFITSFIIIRHKDNIKRLLKGEENKISFNKK